MNAMSRSLRLVALAGLGLLFALGGCAESIVVTGDRCEAAADEEDCCAMEGCSFLPQQGRCVAPERVCQPGGSTPACGPDGGECEDVESYPSSDIDACFSPGGVLPAEMMVGICSGYAPADSGP